MKNVDYPYNLLSSEKALSNSKHLLDEKVFWSSIRKWNNRHFATLYKKYVNPLFNYRMHVSFDRELVTSIYIFWTENVLILDKTKLAGIMKIAKHNYGIEVKAVNIDVFYRKALDTRPVSYPQNLINQISKISNFELYPAKTIAPLCE